MKQERPKIPIEFNLENFTVNSVEISTEKNNLQNVITNSIETKNKLSKKTKKEMNLQEKTPLIDDAKELRPESILLEFAQIAVTLTKESPINSLPSSPNNQNNIEFNKDELIKLEEVFFFDKTMKNVASADHIDNKLKKESILRELLWIFPKKNAFQIINIVVGF